MPRAAGAGGPNLRCRGSVDDAGAGSGPVAVQRLRAGRMTKSRSRNLWQNTAVVLVTLALAAGLPAVSTSTASAAKTLAREGFERSLARWSPTSPATRLDRVAGGRGKHSQAARLRSPRGSG